jgi:hypothetical protein
VMTIISAGENRAIVDKIPMALCQFMYVGFYRISRSCFESISKRDAISSSVIKD